MGHLCAVRGLKHIKVLWLNHLGLRNACPERAAMTLLADISSRIINTKVVFWTSSQCTVTPRKISTANVRNLNIPPYTPRFPPAKVLISSAVCHKLTASNLRFRHVIAFPDTLPGIHTPLMSITGPVRKSNWCVNCSQETWIRNLSRG